MLNILIIFILLVVILYLSGSINISYLKSLENSLLKKAYRTSGEELKIMYKKCDICGAKTVFSEGDDDSNLKIVKIANPDTGEITEKLCCEECYNQIQSQINKKKTNIVKFHGELKNIIDSLKK